MTPVPARRGSRAGAAVQGHVARRAAARAAAEVCTRLGVPATPVRLPAGSTSWVFDVPQAEAVVIVARTGTAAELSARLAAADLLARRLPFVTPHPRLTGPLTTQAGMLATVWQRVARSPGPPPWRAVGAAVRALHDVPVDDLAATGLALPDHADLTDLDAAIARLAATGRLVPADARVLAGCAVRLRGQVADADAVRTVVHGDLHRGNLLTTAGGCVLCDTDELGTAPPAWDLAFLVDASRPDRLTVPERTAFERGYLGALPSEGEARTFARVAHLRRTVRDLQIGRQTPRDRWWARARLDAWSEMLDDWSLDLQPVLGQPRTLHAVRAARRLRVAARRRRPA